MSLYALDNEFWEKHVLLLEKAKFLPLLCANKGVQQCIGVIQSAQLQLEELRVSRMSKQQRIAEQQRLRDIIAQERVIEERLRMTGEDVYRQMTENMQKHITAVKEVTLLCETNITTGYTQRIRRRLRREKITQRRSIHSPHDSSCNDDNEGGNSSIALDGTSNCNATSPELAIAQGYFTVHRKVQRLIAIAQELDAHCRATANTHNGGGNYNGSITARTPRTARGDNSELSIETLRHMLATLVEEGLVSLTGVLEHDTAAQSVFQGILLNAITLVFDTQPDILLPTDQNTPQQWSVDLVDWLVGASLHLGYTLSPQPQEPKRPLAPTLQMSASTQRLLLLKAVLQRRPEFAHDLEIWNNLSRLLTAEIWKVTQFSPSKNVYTTQNALDRYICAAFDAVSCAVTCLVGFQTDRRDAGERAQQLLQQLNWSLIIRCAYVHTFNAYIQVSFLRLLVAKCRADELACCESKVRICFWSMGALEDYQADSGASPPSFQLAQFKQATHDVAIVARAILTAMATHMTSGVVQWHGLTALRYLLAPRASHDQSLRVRVGVMVVEDLLSADENVEEDEKSTEETRSGHDSDEEAQRPSWQRATAKQPHATSDEGRTDHDANTSSNSDAQSEPSSAPTLTRRLSSRGPSRQNSTMHWLVDPSGADKLTEYPKEMQPIARSMQQLLPHILMEHMHITEVLEQWILTTCALSRRTRVVQLWLASVGGMEALTSRALLLHNKDSYIVALVEHFVEATKQR